MYVLETRDLLDDVVYYAGSWTDTLDISKAKKYTLDDALSESRLLRKFGGHYKVVRIPD